MSYKNWLLFGSLGLGAAQSVACSSEFHTCTTTRTCPPGGAGGTAGAAGNGVGGGGMSAGKGGSGGFHEDSGEGGSAGADDQGGAAGMPDGADDAGSGGTAGDSSVSEVLEIAAPVLDSGKTYVPFNGKISASGATKYAWSITSGALPAGLALQGTQSATVTIAGTPSEAGQFPITLSVTDGTVTKSVDVRLVVTHSALFLSDRRVPGVNELFIADVGGASVDAPVQLSASLPAGGSVSSYAWSPDGSKVLYLATQSSGGPTELWVASLASPGTTQRVNAVGVTVSRMVWLKAGNIAAYTTSAGEAYLVDLSGAAPGPSKLAVSGGTAGALSPSPNGNSLGIGTYAFDASAHVTLSTIHHVTWSDGSPKAVTLFQDNFASDALQFSYDGRLGLNSSGNGSRFWDLSVASPSPVDLGTVFSSPSWSPTAQSLIFRVETPSPTLYRGTFDAQILTSTPLVQSTTCQQPYNGPWSPDGKQALFTCDRDLRGISSAITSVAGTDFTLLPGSFLSNAFTYVASSGWSPDSKWVALRANRDANEQFDLYVIRWSTPGVAYKTHGNVAAPGVSTWAFAQDSQTIAFVGIIAPQNNAGLYLTKLPAGGAPPAGALVSTPGSAVVQTDINWLPGSRMIAYRAVVAGAAQLFALPVAADGTAGSPISISGVSGNGVSSYQLAPAR